MLWSNKENYVVVCFNRYQCMADWSDYHSVHQVNSLTTLVTLRHHDVRVGGSIPGLGSFNTVT